MVEYCKSCAKVGFDIPAKPSSASATLFQRAVNGVLREDFPHGTLKIANEAGNLVRLLQDAQAKKFGLRESGLAAAVLNESQDVPLQSAIELHRLGGLFISKRNHSPPYET